MRTMLLLFVSLVVVLPATESNPRVTRLMETFTASATAAEEAYQQAIQQAEAARATKQEWSHLSLCSFDFLSPFRTVPLYLPAWMSMAPAAAAGALNRHHHGEATHRWARLW